MPKSVRSLLLTIENTSQNSTLNKSLLKATPRFLNYITVIEQEQQNKHDWQSAKTKNKGPKLSQGAFPFSNNMV